MSRLRPFRARVGVAGAASLAALSLLVTSLTPLAMRASAADESTQSPTRARNGRSRDIDFSFYRQNVDRTCVPA